MSNERQAIIIQASGIGHQVSGIWKMKMDNFSGYVIFSIFENRIAVYKLNRWETAK